MKQLSHEAVDHLLNYSSYALSILGLIGTFYYGRKSIVLQRRVHSFTWSEVEHGVDMISAHLRRRSAPFDAVLSLSPPGRIVANLIAIRALNPLVEFAAIPLRTDDRRHAHYEREFIPIVTGRFSIGIPKALLQNRKARVLVVDSGIVTGDLLRAVISELKNSGIEELYSVSLIATEFAVSTGKGPDFYWKSVPSSDYSLPWGNLTNTWY
jgi:hypoxanthine phosphoribosyltransferase